MKTIFAIYFWLVSFQIFAGPNGAGRVANNPLNYVGNLLVVPIAVLTRFYFFSHQLRRRHGNDHPRWKKWSSSK